MPIFNKGGREIALNYRPVSLTKVVRKYYKETVETLGSKNYLNVRQYRFRANIYITNLLYVYGSKL